MKYYFWTKIRFQSIILIGMTKDEIIIQSIVDAARKLIQQYGITKTTMEDIAKATGKGKSTLYYYFKSKDEIFDEVIRQEMDDFFNGVKTVVDSDSDPLVKMKLYIISKINSLKEKVNLYRFTFEADFSGEHINNAFDKLRERYDHVEKQLIAGILRKGVNEGVFTIPHDEDVEMLAELLVTCVRGIEMDVVKKDKYHSLPEKAEMLVSIMAKGLK